MCVREIESERKGKASHIGEGKVGNFLAFGMEIGYWILLKLCIKILCLIRIN